MDAPKLESATGTHPFEEAFNEMLPAMRALPEAQIVAVNLSILSAVTKVLGVQPRLLAMKDDVADALPETDRDLPAKLELYARALVHADARYRMVVRANDPIPALADEGTKLRRLLFSDARALIQRGLVDGQLLHKYKGSTGYRDLAFDLHMLAQLFRDCPESVRDVSAARDAELQRANAVAARILAGLRRRTMPDPAVQAAGDLRNRAFTLLTRGYDRVRRAAVFLRWDEGDADALVPSLYAKRRRPKKDTAARRAPNDASHGHPLPEASIAANTVEACSTADGWFAC